MCNSRCLLYARSILVNKIPSVFAAHCELHIFCGDPIRFALECRSNRIYADARLALQKKQTKDTTQMICDYEIIPW